MSRSNKHHYLPEFYLKGYTNENDRFFIYNYHNGRIENKEFYPSQYFFDNRNLIEVNGIKDDLPEKIYSAIDDRYCSIIKKLQQQTDIPNLSIDEMLNLQTFIASIFWRLPSNDSYFLKEYKENKEFTDRMKLVKEDTGEIDEQLTKDTIFNDVFIRSIKPLMPLLLKGKNRTDLGNWKFVYDPKGDFTCSDEPFLFREENPKDIFTSEFIFPLTKSLLLIRTFKKVEQDYIPASIIAVIKLLLFTEGKIYCCCPNKNSLDILKTESLNLKLSKAQVFEILENPELLEYLHYQWLMKQK